MRVSSHILVLGDIAGAGVTASPRESPVTVHPVMLPLRPCCLILPE